MIIGSWDIVKELKIKTPSLALKSEGLGVLLVRG